MSGNKQTALIPAVAELPEVTGLALVIERLAANPSVDVAKLKEIVELQERILRHQAKADFDGAFAEMQSQIPIISEKGEILVDGKLRSRYATNEDIQELVKPILAEHGFSLRFRNEHLDGNRLKVIGILSHRAGHSECDEFVCPPDTSGKKNDIQAIGSTRAYGQRYTTLALLNIATRGTDDDGKTGGQEEAPALPDGFASWWEGMADVVPEGLKRYHEVWKDSKESFRAYVTTYRREEHEARKLRAIEADRLSKNGAPA